VKALHPLAVEEKKRGISVRIFVGEGKEGERPYISVLEEKRKGPR